MHFTYSTFADQNCLQQGDVLQRTPALEKVISEFHAYYLKPDYKHFIVLSQSCDLVPRSGRINSAYLTLAAVRPLSTVIDREVGKYQTNSVYKRANVVALKYRDKLLQFLERLLNNNHPEYLYLHEEPSVGITEPACAFLRLSIAIRNEHYDVCKSARVVCLEPTFQTKLGWLVGNIYSRVGTEDWVPRRKTPQEWTKLLDHTLQQYVVLVDDRKVESVRRRDKDAEQKTQQELRELIHNAPTQRVKDQVIDAVVEQLQLDDMLPQDKLSIFRKRLVNNPKIASLIKT